MTAVIETDGLGKQYGRKRALQDCTLLIPEGKVVGLVGPNGAGKSTLLNLAVGLLAPTSGTITVLDGRPDDGPAQLGRGLADMTERAMQRADMSTRALCPLRLGSFRS